MDLLDGDKVHTMPRMVELVKFYRHAIILNDQGMNGEGFLGTVRLMVPIQLKGAKVQFLPNDDGDGDTRFAVLTAKTGHKEAVFFVGDGQGRLVGLYSLEKAVEEKIDKHERDIKKPSKQGEDATDEMHKLKLEKAFREKMKMFLTDNQLAFICYVGGIGADGAATGLDADAQKRLYIEGNALNQSAGKEGLIKYESYSPVIRRLTEVRERIAFMKPEYIEEDSKSIGLNSPRVFTLSTLTRAYSLSVIDIENPIKLSTDEVFGPVPDRAEFVRACWEKAQQLFGEKWTRPDLTQADRTKYLQEHRRKKTVHFSAIFLDALGRLGFEAGKNCSWQADAELGFLDSLARADYDPADSTEWQDLMMKKSTKADADDGFG
ncbi:MAG: hypothetical protein K2X82_10300 [Gemmataceae bacterium]|nr:hypothetical protein [Gemmataceae bacterium]